MRTKIQIKRKEQLMEDLDLFIWNQLKDNNIIYGRYLSINFKSGKIKLAKSISVKRHILTLDLHLVYNYTKNSNVSDPIEDSNIVPLFRKLNNEYHMYLNHLNDEYMPYNGYSY